MIWILLVLVAAFPTNAYGSTKGTVSTGKSHGKSAIKAHGSGNKGTKQPKKQKKAKKSRKGKKSKKGKKGGVDTSTEEVTPYTVSNAGTVDTGSEDGGQSTEVTNLGDTATLTETTDTLGGQGIPPTADESGDAPPPAYW
eukprot:NODE_1087_length_2268_cov_0.218534.p3 type:complete len:140 gc:universal NODE_1087_length_2268_cov_0.218534:482-63(-)